MCPHRPPCPPADRPDRDAAHTVAFHPEQGWAVVNVLTLIALAPMGPMAGYSASKAAAHSITQALRAELRPRGISVLGAYPGGIGTDMLAGTEAPKAPPQLAPAASYPPWPQARASPSLTTPPPLRAPSTCTIRSNCSSC